MLPDLNTFPMCSSELVTCVPKGSPLAARSSLSLSDFDGQNLIVNEYTKDTTEVHEAGEKVFLNFDPQRISVYEAESEEVITC